jgi:hypothetical protein
MVKEKKKRFKIKRREMSLIIGISPLKKYEAKKKIVLFVKCFIKRFFNKSL